MSKKYFVSTRERDLSIKHIVNLLILGLMSVTLVLTIILLIHRYRLGDDFTGELPYYPALVFLIVLIIYYLFRRQYIKLSYYLLFGLFLVITLMLVWKSGVENQIALLFFAFLITLAGILVELKYMIYAVIFMLLLYLILVYLQIAGINVPYLEWKEVDLNWPNAVSYLLMLFIISVVSGQYNREINRSLNRALQSEMELKNERDLLEIKVEERTSEIKQLQMEQICQLSKLAQHGKSMVGLMHDLINPVTAISLNLSFIEKLGRDKNKAKEVTRYARRALKAARKMENYVLASKNKLRVNRRKVKFLIEDEVKDTLLLFNYKAKRGDIKLNFDIEKGVYLIGERSKFGQIISNLISNAIDAFSSSKKVKIDSIINVKVSKFGSDVQIVVEDNASGIKSCELKKIFDPFFTKKAIGKGIGIGLAITKDIVENDFMGKIGVESKWGEGTKFYVTLPVNVNNYE